MKPDERRHVVVDLCCGSGVIAAVLAAQLRDIELYAADVDPVAVACARRNLDSVGGQVFAGDLFGALPTSLRGRIDILTANTPYVPRAEISNMPPEARLHEALVALDGGADGLAVQRALSHDVAQWLAPGGYVLVETSAVQAPLTAELFTAVGLTCGVHHDAERGGTVVVARMSSA
jgi:release factor glutamine methyltransferase